MRSVDLDAKEIHWICPRPPKRDPGGVRLDRFGPDATKLLQNQIGPLANLRSAPGCGFSLNTDAELLRLDLDRLRHHQPVPQCIDVDIAGTIIASTDLRDRDGKLSLFFPLGPCEGTREIRVQPPTISTCIIAGVAVDDSASLATPRPRPVTWLAIGDSLTQGFSVANPSQTWVERLATQWAMPAWNLGIGGLAIEPDVFMPFLAEKPYELVTIGLGSNNAWQERRISEIADTAPRLAEAAIGSGHHRVVWILPPWKPCEAQLGPPDFMGVPLDAAAGDRVKRSRDAVAKALEPYTGDLEVIGDLMPHDHRLLADGLHPSGLGMAKYADNLAQKLNL